MALTPKTTTYSCSAAARPANAPRLDSGAPGQACSRDREKIPRRFLPEHCLPAQQEHYPQRCEGRLLFPPGKGFGIAKESWQINMAGVRDRKQAHGRRPDGDAPRQVPGERSRATSAVTAATCFPPDDRSRGSRQAGHGRSAARRSSSTPGPARPDRRHAARTGEEVRP